VSHLIYKTSNFMTKSKWNLGGTKYDSHLSDTNSLLPTAGSFQVMSADHDGEDTTHSVTKTCEAVGRGQDGVVTNQSAAAIMLFSDKDGNHGGKLVPFGFRAVDDPRPSLRQSRSGK
ncbi:MAG: hypothetical protein AAGK05_19650, partial [Pseudomonadota bacterium]